MLRALGLGCLLASPQLWQTIRYWPRSRRAHQGYQDKVAIGNIPIPSQLRHLFHPTTEPVDGVFGTEACTFIGLPALLCLIWTGWSWWWGFLGLSVVLSMGKHTPLFRWTHAAHLRIPARYCYLTSLSLAMLAVQGFTHVPPRWQPIILFLQCAHLLLVLPRLWPMLPYCQRWERPSRAFKTPLTQFLSVHSNVQGRISGLPYPLRTGQVNQLHTLGYNGGSQAQWMAQFRGDPNPNGSGAHDWFALNEDGPLLDAYGVRWAYTARAITGKWRPTAIPHLYENTLAASIPPWPFP